MLSVNPKEPKEQIQPAKTSSIIKDLYATAILTTERKLLYSDRGFRKLSRGDTFGFLKRIVQLKKLPDEDDNDNLLPSNIAFKKDTLGFGDTRTNLASVRSSTLVTKFEKFETIEIKNVNELLDIVFETISEGQLLEGNFLTFEGKYIENPNEPKLFKVFEVTVSRLGQEEKVVLNIQDVTEYTRHIATEAKSRAGKYATNILSSELRVPLRMNLDLIEATLNNGRIPQSVKEQFLAPAYKNGLLLKFMMNTILDYSAFVNKKLTLRYQNLALRDSLKECYQLLQEVSEKKNLEFTLEVDENAPKIFGTDHERVKQIILCLLNNALKNTFRGAVKICVKQITKRQVQISIEDTGLGIRPEDLSKIQAILKKGEAAEDDISELGSNVAIAHQLAKILGPSGSKGIIVQSKHVEGSSFSFVLEDKNQHDAGPLKDTEYSVLDEDVTVQDTEWNNTTVLKDKRSIYTVI